MRGYAIDLRIRVIEAYNRKEGSIRQLAKRFSVHWRTVANWVKRFKEEQTVGPRAYRPGPPPKLDEQGLELFRELLETEPDATRRELARKLEARTGVRLSHMGITRAIRRLHWTRKKKSSSAAEADRPDVWKAFGDYAEAVTAIAVEDMVFLDETGIHLAMSRRYGWAPRGERLVGSVPFNRGKNITVIGALTYRGMLTELMFEGALDGPAFRAFVQQCLVPKLRPGQVVILDNLSAHRDAEAREAIEAAGASLLFLPPYHPDLDPIENAWSKFKAKLRSAAARIHDALLNAVRTAILSITPDDAQGWFAHCGYEWP
jgi:transposase